MTELLAAAVVGGALLWLVLQPLVQHLPAAVVDLDPPDPEETPRGQALLALKEIEFDHATGKLSESDFAALNAKYTTAAVAALNNEAGFCAACGAALPSGAIFCAQCGARVTV